MPAPPPIPTGLVPRRSPSPCAHVTHTQSVFSPVAPNHWTTPRPAPFRSPPSQAKPSQAKPSQAKPAPASPIPCPRVPSALHATMPPGAGELLSREPRDIEVHPPPRPQCFSLSLVCLPPFPGWLPYSLPAASFGLRAPLPGLAPIFPACCFLSFRSWLPSPPRQTLLSHADA